MRFLVDAALSPLVAQGLQAAGHDAAHVRDRGLQSAADEDIFRLAAAESRVLVSADTDFGTLLALRNDIKPSVILLHGIAHRRPEAQTRRILDNLDAVTQSLDRGSIVVIEESRVRVRRLPIGGSPEETPQA